MNGRTQISLMALALGTTLAASAAVAQDRGSATTRSLNTGPAQSTLTPRPNAQPPLASTPRAQPTRPRAADPLEALMRDVGNDDAADQTEAASGVTLAAGETEPEPIPITLGYYVRGDMDCDQVWPGEGNLAWLTPTAFTIDYGGCEPGQFLQTGPNSWREEQRCVTESGGNAGGYSVTYEVLGTDVISRSARLAIDGSVEQDDWKACPLESVPENARFGT